MKKEKLMTVCDMVFVLVLCFVVLLATMLLTSGKTDAQPGHYVVSLPRLAVTAGAIIFYLVFMLRRSLKSLDDMTRAWEDGVKARENTAYDAETAKVPNILSEIEEIEEAVSLAVQELAEKITEEEVVA